MKFYSIYKKPKDLLEKCILVKKGFSWENFFFGIFWALYKRIWDLVLIHALLILITRVTIKFYPMFDIQITTIALAFQVIISFYANNLLELKLVSKGYKKIDFIAGDTEEFALLKFFSNSIHSK